MDGELVEGRSSVDESMITGEPVLVKKDEGNRVTGGTINKNGTLAVRATQVRADTVLSYRRNGCWRAAVASADPGAGRSGLVDLRADRRARVHRSLRRLALVRAQAGAGLRDRFGRLDPDHRMSLRAGARHAELDYHGCRPGRTGRRADQDAEALERMARVERRDPAHAL